MGKWVFWLLLVLALGGLIAWRVVQEKAPEAGGPRPGMAGQQGPGAAGAGGPGGGMGRGPASVELTAIQYRDIEKTFQATGTVESMQNVKISPKVSGRIDFLQVREGDRVRRGQVLVRIDQSQVQAEVRQQQANVAEAKYRLAQAQLNQGPNDAAIANRIRELEAALAQAKSRLAQAQLTQESTDVAVTAQIRREEANLAVAQAELTQSEASRAAQLDALKAAIDDAQGKVDNAGAVVNNANAAIKSAQANLDNATTKYQRMYDLYKQGFVAAQDVDDARTTMNVQQSVVETAKGQLQAATAAAQSAAAQKRAAESQAAVTRARLDAELESARAKVAQVQAALDTARANTTQSPAYRQNLEALRAQVAQAQAALNTARANTKQSDAYRQNLAALRAQVAVAQASLDSARAKLQDTVLHSPLDGVVTARSQDPGSLASPGQAILTVQSLHQIWVTLAVPDTVCMKLHLNDPATVAFDALGGRRFPARIAQINPAADLQSRQFTVRVMLDNRDGRFSPGMFAKVTLTVDRATQVAAVPPEALQTERDGSRFVFVVGGDNVARKLPVMVGLNDAEWTAIIGEVKAGDQVVTMSATPVRDGQEVRVAPAGGRGGRGADGAGRPGAAGRPEGREAAGDGPRGAAERAPARREGRGSPDGAPHAGEAPARMPRDGSGR